MKTFDQFRSLLESFRREVPTIDTGPIHRDIVKMVGDQGVVLEDYSAACNKIDLAVHHLDEGLPVGQNIRCSLALELLEEGVRELRNFLLVKGYAADPVALEDVLNERGNDDIPNKPLQLFSKGEVVKTGQVAFRDPDVRDPNLMEVVSTRVYTRDDVPHAHATQNRLYIVAHTRTLNVRNTRSCHKTPTVSEKTAPTGVYISASSEFDYDDPSTWKFSFNAWKLGTTEGGAETLK